MNRDFSIRDGTVADLESIVRLNDSEVPHVTRISVTALKELMEQAFSFTIAEGDSQLAAFLLTLDQNASYQSLNFQWF